MTVGMGVATLLHLLALAGLVGVPGVLVYHAYLRERGLSWRVGIGLALAALAVLFSDVAAIAGYRFGLMLGLWLGFVAGIGIGWWLKRRAVPDSQPISPSNHEASDDLRRFKAADVLFHATLLAFYLAPAFVLYLPLDTDAQGFGYLALMVREGGTLDTLAPWQPDVRYLYSPALFLFWAFLSDLLKLPMHQVMLPFGHLMAGLVVWLCIDFGAALAPDRPRMRWLLPLLVVGGMGLLLALMDSHYTSVMGFAFVTLFLTLAVRAIREQSMALSLLAAIPLAAAALTHPDTIIILLIGFVPFYATFWLSRGPDRTRQTWLRLFVLIPAAGLSLTLPWLLRVLPLFFEEMLVSPFLLSPRHVMQLVVFQGILVPVIALAGLVIAARRRSLPDMLMLTWLVFILDFSLSGLADRLIDLTGINVMRYVYPFSVAWHGPILVYPYLAAVALDRLLDWKPIRLSPQIVNGVLAGGLALIVVAVLLQGPILAFSFGRVHAFGAFSSRADLAAMTYLRGQTPPDSLILNYPDGQEAHWVPVVAERESVAFRDQPFFAGAAPYYERRDALAPVYFNLADPAAHGMLIRYGVDYVIVPQIVSRPDVFGDLSAMMRWRKPDELRNMVDPHTIPWLKLVFEQGGAAVFQVMDE